MEIEIKFKILDANIVRHTLKIIRAIKVSKKKEVDIYFDTYEQRLLKNEILCRLRKIDTAGILSIKEKTRKSKYFKIREEIEVKVSDFQKAKQCLEALGFKVSGGKEKIREFYTYKKTKICIDTLPKIGSFLEIEGTKKSIIEVSKKLGFDYRKGITKSYDELLKEDMRNVSCLS